MVRWLPPAVAVAAIAVTPAKMLSQTGDPYLPVLVAWIGMLMLLALAAWELVSLRETSPCVRTQPRAPVEDPILHQAVS